MRLPGRIEELQRIPIRILELDLSASRADFHVISEMQHSFLQRLDTGRKIDDAKDYPVPAARFLVTPIRQWTRARGSGAAEQKMQTVDRDIREGRQLLVFQPESSL